MSAAMHSARRIVRRNERAAPLAGIPATQWPALPAAPPFEFAPDEPIIVDAHFHWNNAMLRTTFRGVTRPPRAIVRSAATRQWLSITRPNDEWKRGQYG